MATIIRTAPLHNQPRRFQQIVQARQCEGFRNLIPVGLSKIPPEQWHEFTTRLMTGDDYAPMFRKYPNYNAAIITGAINNIIVAECDSSASDEWFKQQGHPETVTAQSRPDRFHYYFKHPGFPVSNSASKFFPNFDIRGDRGIIVAVGSAHKSGFTYRWVPGCSPNDIALGSSPAWLLELLKPAPPRPADLPKYFNGTISDYARAALKSELERAALAPEGQRNGALNDAGFSLGQMIAGGQLPEDNVRTALHSICDTWANSRHSRATVDRAIKAGMEQPRSAPKTHQFARMYANSTISQGPSPSALESPLPFRRSVPGATPYPTGVLGELLEKAARILNVLPRQHRKSLPSRCSEWPA
jgi:hypothetical protein